MEGTFARMTNTGVSRTTMSTTRVDELLRALRGGLIVSCQAPVGDPLCAPEHMAAMAASVAGAPIAAIRAQGVEDVRAVRAAVSLPLVGLWKDGTSGVYITPTPEHAKAIVAAGADLVGVDATGRERPDGKALADTIGPVHQLGGMVLADVSTAEEGVAAAGLGADLVSTTLSGYTPYSRQQSEPDLELVAELASRLTVPVVAEGRIATPEHATAAIAAGAWSVVVGTAITSPRSITDKFAEALP